MKTVPLTLLLTGLLADAALAHPGHGLPGWLHHGEMVVVASLALTAGVDWWLRTRRSDDDR
jgi:hypothetical protein